MTEILDLEQADSALAELQTIAATEQDVKSRYQAQVEVLTRQFAREMVADWLDPPPSLQDRRDVLLQALASFVDGNPELFDTPKSQALPHGELGLRSTLLGIDLPDQKQVEAGLQLKLMGRIKSIFDALNFFGRGRAPVAAAEAVRVKVEVNKQGLLAALKSKRLTETQLIQFGGRIRQPADEFYCKYPGQPEKK